jgi:NMD protein affecting ribosome stability and mRNA decay
MEEDEEEKIYNYCMLCGRKITMEEYETYGGLCQECYELEVAELDMDLEED